MKSLHETNLKKKHVVEEGPYKADNSLFFLFGVNTLPQLVFSLSKRNEQSHFDRFSVDLGMPPSIKKKEPDSMPGLTDVRWLWRGAEAKPSRI